MKEYIPLILGWVLATLFGLLLLLKSCNGGDPCAPDVEIVEVRTTVYDTIPGDSIPYKVISYKPQPVPYPVDVPYFVFQDVDSAEIIAEHFRRYYSTDKKFLAIVEDSVTRNRIQWRDVWFQDLTETVLASTEILVESNKPKFYLGAELDYIGNTIGALRPEAELIFINRYAFSVGTNVLAPQPNFYGGVKFRIKWSNLRKPVQNDSLPWHRKK